MKILRHKRGLQGRWPQALSYFFMPLIIFLGLRWLLIEPFVIPSESMVPQLLIHDHIVVNKLSYGIKPLWKEGWLISWSKPQRGDVIVFRYPENPEIYFIKRVIGVPGDRLEIEGHQIRINGVSLELKPVAQPFDIISPRLRDMPESDYLIEKIPFNQNGVEQFKYHYIRSEAESSYLAHEKQEFEVLENEYFVVGDNRYNSHDSRYWGSVPFKLIVGKATKIWLSCENLLASLPLVCDPSTIRPERILKSIN